MDLITSKVTLHSLPSSGMVPSELFLEIILSSCSETRLVQLMIDPIKVIKTKREVAANLISSRAVVTILVDTQICVSVTETL